MKNALQHPHVRALFWAFVGFFLAALGDVILKAISQTNIPPLEIIATANSFCLAFLFLKATVQGTVHKLVPKRPVPMVVRALFLLCAGYAYVVAYPHLTLASFYVVVFAAPFTITLLASFFLHERLSLGEVAIIALGFFGVLIGVDPVAVVSGKMDFIGIAAAFLGMLCWSCAQVITRSMGPKERRETIVFMGSSVITLAAWALAFAAGLSPIPFESLAFLALCALLGTFSALSLVRAFSLAPAATVSGLHYSQFLPGLLFGYLIFGNVPTFHELAGGAIIVTSGLLLLRYSQKTPV